FQIQKESWSVRCFTTAFSELDVMKGVEMLTSSPHWLRYFGTLAIIEFLCMATVLIMLEMGRTVAILQRPITILPAPSPSSKIHHSLPSNHENKTLVESNDKSSIPNFVASPCSKSNNDYNYQANYSKWVDDDINQYRKDWQSWLATEYPLDYTFEKANSTLITRGSPGFSGRGIVINMGKDAQMTFFRLALHYLRKTGCYLSIEVWAFDGELSPDAIHNLTAMSLPNQSITVRTADDPKNFVNVQRFSSVANSRFEEVLMMDVDGDLFWPDYWKTRSDNPVWKWMNMSCVDEWEQESGMMVVDKRRSWKAIMLNWFLFGDKDLFRFTWKATNSPAHFIQHWLTPAGFIRHNPGQQPFFFYGNTLGHKITIHWDPSMCVDINLEVDSTMPKRLTEIIDIASEFPELPEMVFRVVLKKEDPDVAASQVHPPSPDEPASWNLLGIWPTSEWGWFASGAALFAFLQLNLRCCVGFRN
ncbi:hypothetical protein BC829DRAFT_390329, partial [Chytridium lagenaria]